MIFQAGGKGGGGGGRGGAGNRPSPPLPPPTPTNIKDITTKVIPEFILIIIPFTVQSI